MKKTLFRRLLLVMGITLALTLLMYPLLLPTENYFRLVLQILPVALVIGAILVIPVYALSNQISRAVGLKLKTLRIDSKAALIEYPELKPIARQVSSLKAQIATQMNELNGQQEQLRVLTDNMQEGLLLISSAGRVLSHNHAALQLLGAESVSGDCFPVEDLCSSPDFRKLVDHASAASAALRSSPPAKLSARSPRIPSCGKRRSPARRSCSWMSPSVRSVMRSAANLHRMSRMS